MSRPPNNGVFTFCICLLFLLAPKQHFVYRATSVFLTDGKMSRNANGATDVASDGTPRVSQAWALVDASFVRVAPVNARRPPGRRGAESPSLERRRFYLLCACSICLPGEIMNDFDKVALIYFLWTVPNTQCWDVIRVCSIKGYFYLHFID